MICQRCQMTTITSTTTRGGGGGIEEATANITPHGLGNSHCHSAGDGNDKYDGGCSDLTPDYC